MFSFPGSSGSSGSSSANKDSETKSGPPCVPWSDLMMHSDDETPSKEQVQLSQSHDSILASLKDEDARELVTALMFISTRSTKAKKRPANVGE